MLDILYEFKHISLKKINLRKVLLSKLYKTGF